MIRPNCGTLALRCSKAPETSVTTHDEAAAEATDRGNFAEDIRGDGDVTGALDLDICAVGDIYALWRPTPLLHAMQSECAGQTSPHHALGSVLSHVSVHLTVSGQKAVTQMEWAEREPDIVIGRVDNGSHLARFIFPFLQHQFGGRARCRIVAVEPRAGASLTGGMLRDDFGDTAEMTP